MRRLFPVRFVAAIVAVVGVSGMLATEAHATTPSMPTWSTPLSTTASGGIDSLAYGDGLFVSVGASGTAAYSADGVTWTPVSLLAVNEGFVSVAFGNGTFVAISRHGRVATSSDGMTWTISPDPLPCALVLQGYRCGPYAFTWKAVTYGNGIFVAVESRATGAYSTDGGLT